MSANTFTAAPRLRLGMIGGGQGAFIGAVHRIAARLDDHYELVAGALSSNAERSRASAKEIGIDAARAYASFEDMAKAESAREDGIEVAAIVAPNNVHYPAAKAMLEAGIHVICDKPLTATLEEAESLAKVVEASGKVFVLTHNYTGYPLIREARQLIARGDLGAIRVVQVEYAQDWLAEKLESTGHKQAEWRTDPARAGLGGALGDIGTHAYNLSGFVTGLRATEVCAQATCFVEGRALDDDAQVLMRYGGGARGMLWCSQVAVGNENALKLRIYAEKGGLEWNQENPNVLAVTRFGETKRIATRGGPGQSSGAIDATRLPPGHPEGYLEGFANLYSDAAGLIRAHHSGKAASFDHVLPGLAEGLDTMRFVRACVASSTAGGSWTRL